MANAVRRLSSSLWGPKAQHSITLYRSLVLSRLEYGGFLLLDATPNTVKKLDVLQNSSLRSILGLPKMCSTISTLAEANCPPLHVRRITQLALFCARIKLKHINHPLHQYLPSNVRISNLLSFAEEIPTCTSVLAATATPDIIPGFSPWFIPDMDINLRIPGFTYKSEFDTSVMRDLSELYIKDTFHNSLLIYTDGTFEPNGSLSAGAFFIPSLGLTYSFSIDGFPSIMITELLALREALSWVNRSSLTPTNIVVLTDCRSALQSLQGEPMKSCNPRIILDIYNEISKALFCRHSLKLQWIPGHVGIQGNEIADKAAKAAVTSQIRITYFPSFKDFRRAIMTDSWNLFSNIYVSKGHAQKTGRLLIEDTLLPFRNYAFSRRENCLIRRIRTKSAFSGVTLHKIGKRPSPICATCQRPDSISHALLTCSLFNHEREALFQDLFRLGLTELTLTSIFSNINPPQLQHRIFSLILTYLKDTGLYLIY